MMRSLYSAISGLKNHQIRLDVIGNNIANVNTLAFKRNTVTFKEQFSQTLSAASGPTNATGGSNAKQVGLGVTLGSLDAIHSPGSIQPSGGLLDMAIDGDGYFVVKQGETSYYTRAGNFTMNKAGDVLDANGNYVQFMTSKFLKKGDTLPGSTDVAPADGFYPVPVSVTPGSKLTIEVDAYTSLSISESGSIIGVLKKNMSAADLKAILNPTQDLADLQKLEDQSLTPPAIPAGTAISLGFVQVATFANPQGLEKKGGNLYSMSDNSGTADIGSAAQGSRGKIAGNSLEMSNSDMGAEMVDMIVTQRGFQANSRIISVSDSMLEELVNLKR